MIDFEIRLVLIWPENCVLTDIVTQASVPEKGSNLARPATNDPTGATFKIKDTKLYVLVVTLTTEDNNKLLEQLKKEFKRTIKWNKYRPEMNNN